MIDVIFRKSRSGNFLNSRYFIEVLTRRRTSQLGTLDGGNLEGANIFLSDNSSPIKLDHYELREKQEFQSNEIANRQISNHTFLIDYFKDIIIF